MGNSHRAELISIIITLPLFEKTLSQVPYQSVSMQESGLNSYETVFDDIFSYLKDFNSYNDISSSDGGNCEQFTWHLNFAIISNS